MHLHSSLELKTASSSFYRLVATLFLVLLACACGDASSEKKEALENVPPYHIDLTTAYTNKSEVGMSEFAKSVEYVQLASSQEALIGRGVYPYLAGDYLMVVAFRQVFVFNRNTGAFVKEIRKYGQGPDEYRNTFTNVHMNEEEGLVYIRDNRRNYMGVNIEGETKVSFVDTQESELLIMGFAQLGPDLFAGFLPNYDCARTKKLVTFNSEGEVIKAFTNHLGCTKDTNGSVNFDTSEGVFYRWNKGVTFKEKYNDTLFQVTKDSLIVKAIFDAGERAMPYADRFKVMNASIENDFYQIGNLDETKDYIFFTLTRKGESYSGIYDKREDQTHLSHSPNGESHRFINDLDGFLPFRMSYATEDGKLVGFIEAPDVLIWFEENPEKIKSLPAELQALAQMKEDDNPIVMILELKD